MINPHQQLGLRFPQQKVPKLALPDMTGRLLIVCCDAPGRAPLHHPLPSGECPEVTDFVVKVCCHRARTLIASPHHFERRGSPCWGAQRMTRGGCSIRFASKTWFRTITSCGVFWRFLIYRGCMLS